MILELVLTVCLANATNPKPCHDERLKLVDPPISLLQCMMSSAVLLDIVKWKQNHPEYNVVAWTCREHKPEKDV